MDDRPAEDRPAAAVPVAGSAAPAAAVADSTWWQRHHRQVWLVLALFAAATAPIWGGLLLLWLFAPSSPLP